MIITGDARAFLGLMGYTIATRFADISEPASDFSRKHTPKIVKWKQRKSINRGILQMEPILTCPDLCIDKFFSPNI